MSLKKVPPTPRIRRSFGHLCIVGAVVFPALSLGCACSRSGLQAPYWQTQDLHQGRRKRCAEPPIVLSRMRIAYLFVLYWSRA